MKKYITFLMCMVMFISCSFKITSDILVIDVLSDAQYFERTKLEMKYIGSTVKIAYYGNYRMYIFRLLRHKTNDIYDKQTNTVTSTVIKTDTAYLYHVIKNGSKTGLVYGRDKTDTLKSKTFHLDTLLKYQSMDNESYKWLSVDLGMPTETVKIGDTKMVEKYFYDKTKESDPDSIYRCYDTRYKDIDFTFSTSLDRKSSSKLVKIQLIYNPTHELIGGQNILIGRREMNWSLTKSNFSQSTIRKYFDQFIKDN